jgi:hypothetical protein
VNLASELCQTVGEELFFFILRIFLEVGETQNLPSKIWQIFGDAQCLSFHFCELVFRVLRATPTVWQINLASI